MDCIDGIAQLEDKSINLVIADPPYYKIKDNDWDNQWNSFSEYLDFIERVALDIKRVLADNGSFYIFGDDENIAYVQVRLDKYFTFLNHLVWYKNNNVAIKYAPNFRKFCPVSERILFYSNQKDKTGLETIKLDMDNFTTLRQYFHDFQGALGLSSNEITKIFGNRKAEHCFYWGSTQWDLPTREVYKSLCKLPIKNNGFICREYEELRREYEELRREYEEMRRTFNYQEKIYEVIPEPSIQLNENTNHPTTKPERLIKKFILASSNPGDVVLDPFMGSGTTGVCAKKHGRHFIGFDNNEEYCKLAQGRIETAMCQSVLGSCR